MSSILSVGIVVLNDKEQVLLVRHGEAAQHFVGTFGLPSGKVEPNESFIEAAKRELKEETGLSTLLTNLIELPEVFHATIEQKDGLKTFEWHVFACTAFKGRLTGSAETIPQWVSIEALDEMPLLPNVKKAIFLSQKLHQ